jgi:hypothetical protein
MFRKNPLRPSGPVRPGGFDLESREGFIVEERPRRFMGFQDPDVPEGPGPFEQDAVEDLPVDGDGVASFRKKPVARDPSRL